MFTNEQNELNPQPENSNNSTERFSFPFVRKIREGAITLAQKAGDITDLIPKAAMPLIIGSSISTAVDEGLVVYSAIERNLDLSKYGLANLIFGDLALLTATTSLYASGELGDTKIGRLSRVASLAETAMAVSGSYMLRTGNYEDGIRIAFGTMVLATGHMLISLGRTATSNNYRYSPR
ncbi:MAG: hypothetical protein Q7R49_03650 [Candidatus Daviesbacteria bacterium]|nr:hypothetical protein [Candidatus Daviesbacteria bacterium]